MSYPMREGVGRVSKRSCRGDPERLDVAFGRLISREETFQTQLLERNVVWGAQGGNSGKETQREFIFGQLDHEDRRL